LLTYIAAGRDRGKFRHRDPDEKITLIMVPNKYDAVSLERRTVVVRSVKISHPSSCLDHA
jgi:hypothetical protein